RAVLVPSPTRAHVLGVPNREQALGRGEIGTELVVEMRDHRTLLEELILEPALGIARMAVSLVAVQRGAALVTGHVSRPEHVFRRIGSRLQPFSLVGSTASAKAALVRRWARRASERRT